MRTPHAATAHEDGIAGPVEKIKDAVTDGIGAVSAKAAEGYAEVAEKAHQVWDTATDTSINDIQNSITKYVRKNPGKSLLTCVGVGLAIGFLVRGHRG